MTDPTYVPDYGLTGKPQEAERRTAPDPQEPPAGKSPLIAGLLSLIPGVGHIYLGQWTKGISYFVVMVLMGLLVWWADTTHEFPSFPGLTTVLIVLTVLFWLWIIGSAVRNAVGRPFLRVVGAALLLAFTYILGWQATEVDLVKFFTEFDDTFYIFAAVMWPWDAAVERELEIDIAQAPFAYPCEGAEAAVQPAGGGDGPQITVEPGCGEFAEYSFEERAVVPGTDITIVGSGFEPEKDVEIWWRDPIGQEFRPRSPGQQGLLIVTPDENGAFDLTFGAPQYQTPSEAVGVTVHQVQARQVVAEGPVQLSANFELAIGRMIVTIFQALMATTFGIVLAVPFSFLAARNLMWHTAPTRAIYYIVRFILNVTRSIEPIIWAVIAAVWVGLGPFAGVIAMTIHTIAALGKLYSEAIESIDPGPIEAVTATGANALQRIMYAIVPQIIPPFLSFTIYRWDINVRMSTIIGFVGGGGIGQILFQWINQSRWTAAGLAVWLIAITVSVMDYLSGELRDRIL
jgi:phosphonate transport system permease protein